MTEQHIPVRGPETSPRFPVGVIVEQRLQQHKPWQHEVWEAVGVVAGERYHAAAPERLLIRDGAALRHYLWRGHEIRLYRDEAPSYYFNLMGEAPGLFVICRPVEAGAELAPYLVTACYDQAMASMEVGDHVFRVSFPPELYRWVEAFVVEHYRPEATEKRARRSWTRDAWTPEERMRKRSQGDD